MTEYDNMRERLLDAIHILTDKSLRTLVAGQGMRIDWDEIARSMKNENTPSENFLKPVQTTPVSRFDSDIAATPFIHLAPQGLDAPKSIAAVRDDINQLIRAVAEDSDRYPKAAVGRVVFNRLMAIVEQLAMNIEQRPIPTYRFEPLPYQPFGSPTIQPNRVPYIGDPVPFPGGTTICSARTSQTYQAEGESVAQADGGWEHPTTTDEFGNFDPGR